MNMPAAFEKGFIKFYGRRKGRPLNNTRATALETVLPRVRIELPETGELTPATLLPGKTAYHLEIGFGTGEHLLAQALAHPEIGFIGAEPFINGTSALLAGIEQHALTNIRLWPDDMRPLLKTLPAASLDRIYLLFSDPWPKKRHAIRRVLQQESLNGFARVLKKGGELRIATDDPTLQEWVVEQMAPRTDFTGSQLASRPDINDWPETRYEQKAIAAGRIPHYYGYILNK